MISGKSNLTCLLIILIGFYNHCQATDSLRTENVNGKRVIVHKVDQGQTLYSLARKYQVSVNDIKALNPGMSQLQIGAEVLIPSKNEGEASVPSTIPPVTATKSSSDHVHKVQQGETLFRISKAYGISPQELADYNHVGAAGIKVGQELKIPSKGSTAKSNDSSPQSAAPSPDQNTPKSEKRTSSTGYPSITESGSAQLDASLSTESFYSVTHKSAPVGTLVFIKNKENGNSVHARVTSNQSSVGNGSTIVGVNKTVLDKLEAKSNTFPVEIYYTPEK